MLRVYSLSSTSLKKLMYIYRLCLFCYTDTTMTTFCESGFNPHYTIIFGVITALLIILLIILVVFIFAVSMKKDNDLLNYQKNMYKELKLISSTGTRAKESQNLSEQTPPTPRTDSDGSDPSIPPAQEDTPDYKNNPVYQRMKKVLKDTNLSKRKYKMAKKQLQEDC